MKKDDLKKLIKPLVKECIHEVLLEEGLLSNVVSEVAKGMQGNLVMESAQKSAPDLVKEDAIVAHRSQQSRQKINEHRARLMNAVNADAYNGVNLFENTEPMSGYEASEPKAGSVDLGNPNDPGVDISSLMGGASTLWKAMKK
jgi:hypothetical protein